MSRYLILLVILFYPVAGIAAGIVVEANSPVARGRALSEDIGIEVLSGEFKPILFMGCEIPCQNAQTFSTADDDQTELTIKLFRGRSKSVKEDVMLGTYKLSGIYAQKRGMASIQVLFGVSDGRIWLLASDINGYADISVTRVEDEKP